MSVYGLINCIDSDLTKPCNAAVGLIILIYFRNYLVQSEINIQNKQILQKALNQPYDTSLINSIYIQLVEVNCSCG